MLGAPYSDSDRAMGYVDLKSCFDNGIIMNWDLLVWFTQTQPDIDVSSTMVEDIDVSNACIDRSSVYQFLNKFMHVDLPIPVRMDNQGDIYMFGKQPCY